MLLDGGDEIFRWYRHTEIEHRETRRLQHHGDDLLADIVQVALHRANDHGADLFRLLGNDQRFQYRQCRMHAFSRHHHLRQEVFIHLETPADLGDAGRHRTGDERACRYVLFQRGIDEIRGSRMFTVDNIPLDLMKQILDVRRRIVPTVSLARCVDIVFQIFDIELFLGVDLQRHS